MHILDINVFFCILWVYNFIYFMLLSKQAEAQKQHIVFINLEYNKYNIYMITNWKKNVYTYICTVNNGK